MPSQIITFWKNACSWLCEIWFEFIVEEFDSPTLPPLHKYSTKWQDTNFQRNIPKSYGKPVPKSGSCHSNKSDHSTLGSNSILISLELITYFLNVKTEWLIVPCSKLWFHFQLLCRLQMIQSVYGGSIQFRCNSASVLYKRRKQQRIIHLNFSSVMRMCGAAFWLGHFSIMIGALQRAITPSCIPNQNSFITPEK